MAPEIVINRKYDARADLYSIGVILYECLFGNAPYSSKTIDELLEKIHSRKKIELPANVKISNECEDLLTRLLQHDPDMRISFQDFFNHDFVDMKHAPSDENMERAIEIFRRAVDEDTKQNYSEAYHLYCEGLTYFVPSINAEVGAKKVALRERAASYLKRAEEIKQFVIQSSSAQNVNVPEPILKAPSSSTQTVQSALEPTANYKALYEKCYSNDQLKNGLEIGKSGEYYAYEHKLEHALENLKRALTILVPLLNKEVDPERKRLLHKQILEWMKEAESIKSILETQKNIELSSSDSSTNSHCVIS
jgi:serine/threonine-protein kinase ULK/ATG1